MQFSRHFSLALIIELKGSLLCKHNCYLIVVLNRKFILVVVCQWICNSQQLIPLLVVMIGRGLLRALIIITDTDTALRRETVGPEAADIDVGVSHLGMSKKEPGTEDWLGKNVKDGVGNDFLINGGNAGSVGNTPDAVIELARFGRSAND
jgi:hypothetical protein